MIGTALFGGILMTMLMREMFGPPSAISVLASIILFTTFLIMGI